MFDKSLKLAQTDPELFAAIQAEDQRQEDHIELIASENYCSPAVMEAQGCQMTNKYAEGYPGKRYYGGCEHVDVAENLAHARDALDWYTFTAARDLVEIDGGDVVIELRRFRTLPVEIARRLLIGAIGWITGADYAPRRAARPRNWPRRGSR